MNTTLNADIRCPDIDKTARNRRCWLEEFVLGGGKDVRKLMECDLYRGIKIRRNVTFRVRMKKGEKTLPILNMSLNVGIERPTLVCLLTVHVEKFFLDILKSINAIWEFSIPGE